MPTVGRGIRNAFRGAVRAIAVVVILGLAIALSVVMLIAHHSVTDEVATTLSSVGDTVTITPPDYSIGAQHAKNLTTGELAPIARLHGVTSLDSTLSQRATPRGQRQHATTSSSDRTSLRPANSTATVYFSGSTQPTDPANIGASTLQIVSGQPISGTSSADTTMISTAMAKGNRLTVGSTLTAYGTPLTVVALFDSDNQAGDDTVITSLPVLQHLTGDTGQVSRAVVTVASLTDLATITAAIQQTFGPSASVTSDLAAANQTIGDLDSVKNIALYSLAGAIGTASVILLLVMVLIVRERKREIGILKAIGATNSRIIAQFTSEALTFTLLGWIVGLVGGIAAASAVTSTLVSHSGATAATHLTNINARVGSGVTLEGLATALAITVLASTATTWTIGRIQPAEVLRNE